ncbi:TVG0736554 [Thermoplasma volcanium GSS1]|uniref:TVG0736554 protein n=1 Tax=Thermoplasma volcanium (strain ATCC 51530 / DSM 4299 / JCM 9571 / NBRC 15438 / GSS1) TaxID=273116 RepID=Q97AS9_THEVO|nr:hypothetical protein [Thermoplasma volcanium]BAB59872.1 TVG0736554 [Thermoplasma volcanium GSS1]
MGINIRPEERSENNLTRLNIKYDKGNVETPNRFVNRYDINAKSHLGAHIPLTRIRNLFIYEEPISNKELNSILNTNDYLATLKNKIEDYFIRIENKNCLKAVYIKLTGNVKDYVFKNRDSETSAKIKKFIFDLSSELNTDFYIFQSELLNDNSIKFLNNNIVFSPLFYIKDHKTIQNSLPNWITQESTLVPFISFTYSSYLNANISYQYIIKYLDKIHESDKGIISTDIPRIFSNLASPYGHVSAPHYSSFIISDITAEIYNGGHGNFKKVPNTRIFEKTNLALPKISNKSNNAEIHKNEDSIFGNDENLKSLFWRTLQNQNVDMDIKNNRPAYISRIHESVMTSSEYDNMRNSIKQHDLMNYRKSKMELNKLLENQKL